MPRHLCETILNRHGECFRQDSCQQRQSVIERAHTHAPLICCASVPVLERFADERGGDLACMRAGPRRSVFLGDDQDSGLEKCERRRIHPAVTHCLTHEGTGPGDLPHVGGGDRAVLE
ncbi:hypothetical protein GCM10010489_39000 [Microbacterium saperdae]|nr:hypothetical protein GCM10010489_39000 [Microbacterium saperdae]